MTFLLPVEAINTRDSIGSIHHVCRSIYLRCRNRFSLLPRIIWLLLRGFSPWGSRLRVHGLNVPGVLIGDPAGSGPEEFMVQSLDRWTSLSVASIFRLHTILTKKFLWVLLFNSRFYFQEKFNSMRFFEFLIILWHEQYSFTRTNV